MKRSKCLHPSLQHDLAVRLVRHRAQSGIVKLYTGLSYTSIRALHHAIHKKAATSGPLPHSIFPTIADVNKKLQVMVFFSIYKSMYGDEIYHNSDAGRVLEAYDRYLTTTDSPRIEPISYNLCWVMARDLRSNLIPINKCANSHCGNEYPDALITSPKMENLCPACVIKQKLYCVHCGAKLRNNNRCSNCHTKSGKLRKHVLMHNNQAEKHTI